MAKDVISDRDVYQRNEKMFEEFLKRMRSDNEAYFLDWVPKFTQWLGNPKAYYRAARPKIVEILENAEATIIRLNNNIPFDTQDGINPSIESRRVAFITLVEAVAPYHPLFIEPQLNLRLGLLFAAANGRPPPQGFPISSPTQQNPSSHLADTIDPRSLTLNKAPTTSSSTQPTGLVNHAIGASEKDVKKEPEPDVILLSRTGQTSQPSKMPSTTAMPTPISRVRKMNRRSSGSKSQSPKDAMNGSAPTPGPTTPKQPLPPSLSRRTTPASSLFQTPPTRSSLGTSQDPIVVGDVDDDDEVEIIEIVSKSTPRAQPPVLRAVSTTAISPPKTPPIPQKTTTAQPSSTSSNPISTRTKPTLAPLQTAATQTSPSHNSAMPFSPSSSTFPSAVPQTPTVPPPTPLSATSASTPQANVPPPLHSPTASINTIASAASSNTLKKKGKTKKKPMLSAVGAPSVMPWAQDDLKWFKEHKGHRGEGASPGGGSPVVPSATPTAASPVAPTWTTITTSGSTVRPLEQPPKSDAGDGPTPMDVDSVSQHGGQPSTNGLSTPVQSDMSAISRSPQVSGAGSNGAVAAAQDSHMDVDDGQTGKEASSHAGNISQPPRDGVALGVVSAMPDLRDHTNMQAEPAFSDTGLGQPPGYRHSGIVHNDVMMPPMSPSSSSLSGALGDSTIHRGTPSVSSRSVSLSANPPVGRTEQTPDPAHVRKGSSGPSRGVSVSADSPAAQLERAMESATVVDVAKEDAAGDVVMSNESPMDVVTTSNEPSKADMELNQQASVSESIPSNDSATLVEHPPTQVNGLPNNESVSVVEHAGDQFPHRAASRGAPLANGTLGQASFVESVHPPPPSMNGFSDLEMAHGDDTHSPGDSPLARARALSPATVASVQSVVTNASSSSKVWVIDPDASQFNSNTVVSLGITHGDIAGKIVELDLVINNEQAKPLSLWCRRHELEADVYIGVCLSLACYERKSSIPVDGEYDERVLTPILLGLQPHQWPSKRQLLAVVESTKRGQTCLCLSPPDMVTEDGFVDISHFVGEGDNAIKFWMGEDMSDLMFVLFAHPPTKSQLRSLAERHAKDREWRSFLDKVSAPLDLPDVELPKGRRAS